MLNVLEVPSETPPGHLTPAWPRVCQTVVTLKVLQTGAGVPGGRWLRIGEVADQLGVSVGTARNYFDAGEFRPDKTMKLKHGDRRVWSEEVERYLRERAQQAEPPTGSPS